MEDKRPSLNPGRRPWNRELFRSLQRNYAEEVTEMKKIIVLLFVLLLEGCVLLRDAHPELNREFDVLTMRPGEYPY